MGGGSQQQSGAGSMSAFNSIAGPYGSGFSVVPQAVQPPLIGQGQDQLTQQQNPQQDQFQLLMDDLYQRMRARMASDTAYEQGFDNAYSYQGDNSFQF